MTSRRREDAVTSTGRCTKVFTIQDKINKDLPNEQFDLMTRNEHVKIERIVSKGHVSPESGWYGQDRNEWVMIVRGEAVLSFEDGSSVTMKEGDYMNIEAHRKYRVEWTTPEQETIWLAVHYCPLAQDHAGQIGHDEIHPADCPPSAAITIDTRGSRARLL